jgi:hypothetical protein
MIRARCQHMTRAETIAMLAAIERVLDDRTEIWRIVLQADGTIVRHIYVGSFMNAHHEPSSGAPHKPERGNKE